MKDEILFIGNANAFTIGTFLDNLAAEGFTCDTIVPKTSVITKTDARYKSVILFLDENCFEEPKLAEAIQKYVNFMSKNLYIIGYESELAFMLGKLPKSMVTKAFTRPVSAAEVALELPHLSYDEEATKRKHILVVDDSGPMLRSIKSWLEPKYKVSMANSAAAAMLFLASNKPDLILLDYEMPGCDGPTLHTMINSEESTSGIPVMYLTGKDDLESVANAAAHKPVGYLLKSQSDSKIIARINDYFAEQI